MSGASDFAPETQIELEKDFYEPKYADFYKEIQKDLVLANLNNFEREKILACSRLIQNSKLLKTIKGFDEKDADEIEQFFMRELAMSAETSRAKGGWTAKLYRSFTHFRQEKSEQKLTSPERKFGLGIGGL